MAQIIVLDDDEQIRDLLRLTLEAEKHQVRTASNGEDGIKLHTSQAADIIIVDVLMPVREGISTIYELRREFPDVKIIAISGGGQFGPLNHYLGMAKKMGALRAIAKPFSGKEILDAVSELLDNR